MDMDALRTRSWDSLEGLGEADPQPVKRTLRERIRLYGPGLAIAGIVAIAAKWLSEHFTAPVLLFALLLGMGVNFASRERTLKPGIDFAGRAVLRVGVALLGARITLDQVRSLGLETVILVIAAVASTITVGWMLARTLKLGAPLGILMGGAVAICGASAALAIAAIIPKTATHERDTILTVIGVTALSTIAMILYPVAFAALHLDARATGILIGATIHDVAQVVGAGYAVSKETGDVAVIVKLLRVALLLPAVIAISLMFRKARAEAGPRPPILPMVLVAFAALVIANSLGIVPKPVRAGLEQGSFWCLAIAIAALGAKTELGDLVRVGWARVGVIVGATAFLAAFALAGLMFVLPALAGGH
jgi:uncharacterized integral membrane protein (TIGR00698 family)